MDKKEKMLSLITRWNESGISVSAFCRNNNIGVHTFNYWRKRLNRDLIQINDPMFVELKPEPANQNKSVRMEIEIPGGIHIRIY